MTKPQSRIDRWIIAILNKLNPADAVYRADKHWVLRWLEGCLLELYHSRRRNEETMAVEQAQQSFIAGRAPDDGQAPR